MHIMLMHRRVSTEAGLERSMDFGAKFLEVSAKTGENTKEVFKVLLDLVEEGGKGGM